MSRVLWFFIKILKLPFRTEAFSPLVSRSVGCWKFTTEFFLGICQQFNRTALPKVRCSLWGSCILCPVNKNPAALLPYFGLWRVISSTAPCVMLVKPAWSLHCHSSCPSPCPTSFSPMSVDPKSTPYNLPHTAPSQSLFPGDIRTKREHLLNCEWELRLFYQGSLPWIIKT